MLQGVLSGPYAGGVRLVSAAKLPRAARQRLADVLAGRAEPTPILHEAPAGLRSRFRATWAALLAMVALTTCTALGFADPRAAFAYQPTTMVAAYVAAMVLLGYALLALHRRRALASGSSLAPGRYLLPLDVVEVPAPDAEGEQVIVVTPLGDARDARVRSRGKKSELVIVLERGAELTFALREERMGDTALRRLEHAQTLLEQLTYARDLQKALAHDALFDVRVDDSWAAVAPAGPASKRTRRRQRLLHGPLATAGTLVLAGALGVAALHGRNFASDRALYLRALHLGTSESLNAYLARGTSHREEALALRDRLEQQRAEFGRHAAESRSHLAGFEGTPRAAWELTPEQAKARSGTVGHCVAALHGYSLEVQPKATRILAGLVERAGRTGDSVIPVRIFVEESSRPPTAAELDHEARAATTIWALERIWSDTCPATLAKLVRRPVERARIGEPGFEIRTVITWHINRAYRRNGIDEWVPTFVFEVTLRGIALNDVVAFSLSMAPPDSPPNAVRERSLFVVPSQGESAIPPLLTARAYDRLYDELYGLFFMGDPRVPLREGGVP